MSQYLQWEVYRFLWELNGSQRASFHRRNFQRLGNMSLPYNFSFPFSHVLCLKDSRCVLCYGSIQLFLYDDRSLPHFLLAAKVNTGAIRRKRVPIFISPTIFCLFNWCKERSFEISLSLFFRTCLCLSVLVRLYPLSHISLILKYGAPPCISCGLECTHDF